MSLLLLLGGCESIKEYRIAAAPETIPMGWRQGGFAAEKTHWVLVEPLTPVFSSSQTRQIPTFRVSVKNRGTDRLPFSPSDVLVTSGSNPVRTYSLNELIALIEENAERDADEYSGQQAEVFLRTSGSGNRADVNDPSATMAKIAAAKRTNAAASQHLSMQEQMNEVADLIAPIFVPPGETAGGVVKLRAEDIQPGQPLRVVVTVEGEQYEFVFNVTDT